MLNWKAKEFGENDGYDCITGGIYVVDERGETVVIVDAGHHGQTRCGEISEEVLQKTKAVANLIASAPAMHRALKKICRQCNCRSYCHQDAPNCDVRKALEMAGQ